jgi:hypothetical protein
MKLLGAEKWKKDGVHSAVKSSRLGTESLIYSYI